MATDKLPRVPKTQLRFKLMTTSSNIMINYHLSQKLKLIRNNEFNRLTTIIISSKHKRTLTKKPKALKPIYRLNRAIVQILLQLHSRIP